MKRIVTRLVVLALVITATTFGHARVDAAGSASLSLSPGSGSYQKGTSFTVTIYENSGSEPVNVVETYLSYDASKLQFNSINNSSSDFDASVDNTGGGGSVHITRYRGGGASVTGSQEVSRVNFTVLGSTGTTSINFVSGSHIVNASTQQDMWNGGGGATFTLTAPSSSTSSSGTSAPTAGSSSSSVAASNSSKTSATPGAATTPGAAASGTVTTPDGQVVTEQSDSVLGVETGNEQTFLVAIRVLDPKGVPAVGYKVTIDGTSATTDSKGIASFINVTAGNHKAEVQSGKRKVLADFTVDGSKDVTSVQTFEVHFVTKNAKWWPLAVPLAIAFIAGVVIFAVRRKRSNP